MDDIRLLTTSAADDLARLTASLAVLDQAIDAMQRLLDIRRHRTADPVVELSLLQFSVTQFLACFRTRRGVRRPPLQPAFEGADRRFFDHVVVLGDQLSGLHARLTGQTEVVLLLKHAGARAGVMGLTTRSRRPDRMTALELSSILSLMERGRLLYGESVREARGRVMDEVAGLAEDELLALDPAPEG